MKKILIILLLLISIKVSSQTYENPVFYSKSHKTLFIEKIELTPSNTIIYLFIENQKITGESWFCADKNIYVEDVQSEIKYNLIKSEGIPVCPDSKKFTKKGERLYFKLYFKKLPKESQKINLVENCNNHCFSFKEIVLNNKLSKEIRMFEQAIILQSGGKNKEALQLFLNIEAQENKTTSRYAYSLYAIPILYYKENNFTQAKAWYNTLKKSTVKDKNDLLEKIKEIEFFYKIDN